MAKRFYLIPNGSPGRGKALHLLIYAHKRNGLLHEHPFPECITTVEIIREVQYIAESLVYDIEYLDRGDRQNMRLTIASGIPREKRMAVADSLTKLAQENARA